MLPGTLSDSREKALVVRALVELVNGVHASCGGEVAECNFVRTDANNWSVEIEEILDGAALTHANDMGSDPKIGDSSIPGPREPRERREKDTVHDEDEDVAGVEGYRKEDGG